MATYCYKCVNCSNEFSDNVPVEQRNNVKCPKCGKPARRSWASEFGHRSFKPGNWPLTSDAMGVHPTQITEAVDQARKAGIPTDFTRDGRPILTSPGHRKRYAEMRGFYDLNGGYSDPQRQ